MALCLCVFFVGCSKFEDGGYHYASSKNIIGSWSFQQIQKGSTPIDDSVFSARYRQSSVRFEKGSLVRIFWCDADGNVVEEQNPTYVFNYNKNELHLYYQAYDIISKTFVVKKLTKSDFVLEYVDENNVIYNIQLEKKK